MVGSPYTPGEVANSVPGRRDQLSFYEERAEQIADRANFVARIRVDYAARGVGKTSLLREAERIFKRKGIATVWVTADEEESLLATVLEEMRGLAAGSGMAEVLSHIDSATLALDFGPLKGSLTVSPATRQSTKSASASKSFAGAFKGLTESLLSEGRRGLVILVDEVQSADKQSLRALAYAWQEMKNLSSPVPAGLFAVGLPGSQDHINAAVTFSERFDFRELFGLDDGGVVTALADPAFQLGVHWDRDALDIAVKKAEGYPYKVQLIGDATWTAAGNPEAGTRITSTAVEEGMPEVDRQMESLFKARWRTASKRQREFLIAIAELGGRDVKREDIANRLGMTTQAISVTRDRLLRRGLVDASRHGRLSFTVPGFAEYILDQ